MKDMKTDSAPPTDPRVGTLVSLYSGAGGLDLGFTAAGFTPIWANDADPVAVETYNKLMPAHVATEGTIEDQELPGRGSADLVIGGPPCQGFSVAGRMDPDDPRSRHVMTFLDVVERLRPRAFVMENVKALAVSQRWRSLIRALRDRADSLGFATQLMVLDSAHYGVPQSRQRMFLIGRVEGSHVQPKATTRDHPVSVRTALSSLPRWSTPGNDTTCEASVTPAKKPVLRRSPYAGMLFNGQGRPLNLDRPAPTLPASMGGNRTPIVDQRQVSGERRSWIEEYHRHLMDGGSPIAEVPEFMRRITVEEAAALQTFPAGTYWAGPTSAQYRQIGNAVPPLLAHHLAVAVREALDLS
jgi:DNA (cytosine-5)-methyltransferase 1